MFLTISRQEPEGDPMQPTALAVHTDPGTSPIVLDLSLGFTS